MMAATESPPAPEKPQAPPPGTRTAAAERWEVLLLATCQALSATSNAVMVTTSALIGQTLSPGGLATLPIGMQMVAVMLATMPASLLMKQIGRRAGFSVGAGFGIAAGTLGCAAIMASSFALFCAASVLYGVFMAFGMYYRFAAADVASPAFRARAISYVMAGGVVAAIAGPEIAKATRELFAPVLFAGCYAAIACLAASSLLVLAQVRIPPPNREERTESGRPMAQIARQPAFLVALGAGAVAQGVMVLVMTATPHAMAFCGLGFNDTAFVIQWHVLGMFAPSFFTGHLITRFGRLRIMSLGAVIVLAALGINLSGVALVQFWGALLLLGLGWNFLFVGATDLLTTTYEPTEKAKVQAVNDLTVFTTAAIASLASGALHHLLGWQAVNLSVILPLFLVFGALLWLKRHQTRSAVSAEAA
jgi:MFS family permease